MAKYRGKYVKTVRLLSDLIGEQIKNIPPKERRQKTEHTYRKLLARLRKRMEVVLPKTKG